MSMFVDIDTDPHALRTVAEQIKQYSLNQMYIIENYYYKMLSLQDDIETERYKEIIEELRRNKSNVEDIHQLSVLAFAIFLVQKAELLESYQKNSGTPITPITPSSSSSNYPRPSSSPSYSYDSGNSAPSFQRVETSVPSYSIGNRGSYSYNTFASRSYEGCLSNPISSYKGYTDFDKSAFKNGEYQTYIVNKPFTAYRYFGSYDSPGRNNLENGNYSRSPYESDAHKKKGWGSEAAGRWASPICSNDSDYIRNALALKQSWGNDNIFVCEMVIPKGTVVSIGSVEKQDDLEGGQTQLFIHGKYDDVIKMPNGIGVPDSEEREKNDKELFGDMLKNWIKRCGPIESFDFQQNEPNDNDINN